MTVSARLLAVALLGAAVAVSAFLAMGPLLRVDAVTVRGYDGPRAERVREAMTILGQSGTALRSPDGAIQEYAQRTPTIRAVRVARDGMTGVTVTIATRHPVAVAHGAGAPVVLADDGTAMRGIPARGLATVRWQGNARAPEVATALAFADELPAGLRGAVKALGAKDGQLRGYLSSGTLLRLGDADGARAKGRALAAIWRAERERLLAAEYVDLAVPERVVLGPAVRDQ